MKNRFRVRIVLPAVSSTISGVCAAVILFFENVYFGRSAAAAAAQGVPKLVEKTEPSRLQNTVTTRVV